jgi:hypothetical protein
VLTYMQCSIAGSRREFNVYGIIHINFRFYLILQHVMGIYTSVLKQPERQANHSPHCNTEQGHARVKHTRNFSSSKKASYFTPFHRTTEH